MSKSQIVVIDYGMGNIHSIVKALRLYSSDVVFTNDPAAIAESRALVLPGDGAFPAAMDNLQGPLESAIRAHLQDGGPLLGVCIGFQILFEDSDEVVGNAAGAATGPAVTTRGLGLIPGRIRRFTFPTGDPAAVVRVPHMGWNRLIDARTNEPGEYMYFIHSYRAQDVPDEFVVARCEYAGDVFPAVVRNAAGNILAAQFHPEKSDRVGLQFLEDWVASL